MKQRVMILALLLLLPAVGDAATYYVSPTGSNTSPYDTWAKAATTPKTVFDNIDLGAGDIVELDGGESGIVYNSESGGFVCLPGVLDGGCTIRGSREAGHDGTVTIQSDTSTTFAIRIQANTDGTITLDNLTIKGNATANGIDVRDDAILMNCTLDGSIATTGFPVGTNGAVTLTITKCRFLNSASTRAVYLNTGGTATISYCRFSGWAGNPTAGIVYAFNSTINSYNNIYTDIPASYFYTSGGAASITSTNDLFMAAGSLKTAAAFNASSAGDAITLYNALYLGSGRLPELLSSGSGTVTFDPSCAGSVYPRITRHKYPGRIAIVVDDSYYATYKTYSDSVKGIAESYGLSIGFAIPRSRAVVNATSRWAATEAEVQTALLGYQTDGHEIINHTWSHANLGDSTAFLCTYSGAGANPRIVVSGVRPNLTVTCTTDSGNDLSLDITDADYGAGHFDLTKSIGLRSAIDAHADWAVGTTAYTMDETQTKALDIATTSISGADTPVYYDDEEYWESEITDMTTWLESFLGVGTTKAMVYPFGSGGLGQYNEALKTWLAANIATTHAQGARTMEHTETAGPPSCTLLYANLIGAGNATNRMAIGTIPASNIASDGAGTTAEAEIRANVRAICVWAAETGNPTIITVHDTDCTTDDFEIICDEISQAQDITVMLYGDLVEYLVTATALTDVSDYRLQAGSPAINAGTDVGLTTDYIGTAVPQGALPDIGAYEFLLPTAATTPDPADDAVDVAVDATLSWADGGGAATYDVYLDDVLVSDDQAGTTYDPGADFVPYSEHTWRIDSTNSAGTTTGVEWSFRVETKGGAGPLINLLAF